MRLDNPFNLPDLIEEHLEQIQAPARAFEAQLLGLFDRIAQRHLNLNVPPPELPEPPLPIYRKLRLVKRNARL